MPFSLLYLDEFQEVRVTYGRILIPFFLYLNEFEEVSDLVPNIDALVLPVLIHICKVLQGPDCVKEI
jgi:hypothetical protein